MEAESSLAHSQVPATCLYPEPAQSSPYPHISAHFTKRRLVFGAPEHGQTTETY
jgi:hypothetical protein